MKKYQKTKPKTALWWVGVWATLWWGISCLYLALLVWTARYRFVALSDSATSAGFWRDWGSAISQQYQQQQILRFGLAFIIVGWLFGAAVWMRELKTQKLSRKAAFKDLFLTIRR